MATVVLNCCNGISEWNWSGTASQFWQYALLSIAALRCCHELCKLYKSGYEQKTASLFHGCSTWNVVICCVVAQARTHFCSNFAGSLSGWSCCDTALQSKHMGSRHWPFSYCSNCYLFKPKAKLPVMIAESVLSQNFTSFFLIFIYLFILKCIYCLFSFSWFLLYNAF